MVPQLFYLSHLPKDTSNITGHQFALSLRYCEIERWLCA